MARRFQSRSRVTRGPRRQTAWIAPLATGQVRTVAVSTALLHASVDFRGTVPGSPLTIVRTFGLFTAIPTTLSAASECFGAYGICIVNGEAFDAGIVSLPSPLTEGADDRWFVHGFWNTSFCTVASPGNSYGQGFAIQIDSKSMRKVGTGDVMVSVIESGPGLDSARVYWNIRTLMKLH